MLLTAVAGAGKTSIAHSIAEKCASEGLLLLTFFFKAGEQSRPDHLFSGMARSLATRDPSYCASIISILKDDPTLATAPFIVQFEKLVAGPLLLRGSPSGGPVVVIVDALDECEPQVFECLADILRKEAPRLPSNIKFFATSRHFDLVDRFLSPTFPIERLGMDLLDDTNKHDCTIYIRAQLRSLKDAHPSLSGFIEEDALVHKISEKAGGLFIWISVVFRYMKLSSKNPRRTLDRLLIVGTNRSMASPDGMMDALYTSILDKCSWKDEDFVHDYPIVMGAVLIARQPLSISAWDSILLPLLKSSVRDTLSELTPLLSWDPYSDTPIRIIHQSFRDFLMGQIEPESPNHHHYVVDTTTVNAKMALRFTEILNKDLCCVGGLGLIEDLAEKDELPHIPQETLSAQLSYSCQYIVYHLIEVQEPPEELSVSVLMFLNQHMTRWVEVCIRTERYISLSLFPEWAKLSVGHFSEEDIHALIQVLDKARANVAFFSRYQEAYELANDSVTLCRCLVSKDSESYTPDLARSLRNLRASLRELGRHSEALPVIEESVKLWRELVAVDPTSYTPDLARSLLNLGASLTNLGRHSEALPGIEECVKLWHELVAVHPTSYTPDLAQSLRILNNSLDNLGRHSEALPVIEECVKLWRKLVAVHPTSYTLDFARSLRNLNNSLNNLGRHSEALPVIDECVKLWRELVAVHPTSHTPDLARSLRNLNKSLDNLGRHSEALPVIEECVGLWRELVAIHPTSYYTLHLARSLLNLNSSLHQLGRHSEALSVIEESVKLWRELVVVHLTSYTPGLARSLQNLKVSLDNLGHHSEALPVIEECVKLWRELVAVHPTSYTPDLARSLHNLACSFDFLGRPTAAVASMEESISLWRLLHVTHPTSYSSDLALSLRVLSGLFSQLGHYTEALNVGEESRSYYHQLHSQYPDVYINHLRWSYSCIADALESLGRHHELAILRTLMQNL
ncbi:uncharacterized protein EI90DRAFT_2956079 [Cantharellus anzutake]|uniref:uncharacterized protein n=1 Tax=Cantharellus anzutake TaxID=1750568 RepID=UPI001904C449|nr:uncharacterized protein EI90DRAFT_2956079 [Cantharellus anzutake]KAF8310609.1 hypothetical protein EI90DRAFT_2956079 [Cantharellus anzutake]